MTMAITLCALLCVALPQSAATLDWATIVVEREAFFEDTPGVYGATGRFDGVGMIYISAARKQILFRGLRRIATPHLGQARDAQYEMHQETFTITSMTTFERGWEIAAVNDGPSARAATGTLRFSPGKTPEVGTVVEFQLDEQGQEIKGVMNRLKLAKSSAATSLLRRFEVVFFGGNVVSYKD